MTEFTAQITVMLKPLVNDPQGLVVKDGLLQLGFVGVKSVRVGKQIQVVITAEDPSEAEKQAVQMCEQLLRNPVIEDYSIKLEATAMAGS